MWFSRRIQRDIPAEQEQAFIDQLPYEHIHGRLPHYGLFPGAAARFNDRRAA